MLGFSALGELALGQSVAEVHDNLVADGIAFTVTGQDAFVVWKRKFAVDPGAFTLSGIAITSGRVLTAEAGSFAVSGQTAKRERRHLMITMTRGGDNGII